MNASLPSRAGNLLFSLPIPLMKTTPIRSAFLALIFTAAAHGQVPTLINYQGRVAVGGVNFDGTGQFKFALVDGGVNQNVTATAAALVPVNGGGVLSINVSTAGSGYVTNPAVTITDSTGTGATAEATIFNGTVSSIQITNAGNGYSVTPTVTIAPPPVDIITNTYWSNDQTSGHGSEPGSAIPLPVVKGNYSVLLGDSSSGNGMRTIGAPDFQHPDVRLRVWFDDGTHGFQLLTPDQRLAPTAYLADGAVTASAIADASIGASKIANGAVGSDAVAGGAINFSHLRVPISPSVGQFLSYNGTDLAWAAPGGSGAGWLLGGNGGTTGSNFLGTTDNQNLVLKTKDVERLRLTTSGELLFQKPDNFPVFGIRNGLGIYGVSNAFDDVGKLFAGANVLGPVLYGQSGGGLGVKSSTNQETLALRWYSSGNVGIAGDLTYDGKLGKLDTIEQPNATVRASDFLLGHSTRRGTPGRAVVDFVDAGKKVLVINFGNDWAETYIEGAVTRVRTLRILGGADLAEPFPMSQQDVTPGTVVVIDSEHPGKLRRSAAAYDNKVAGIVSGANGIQPGISMIQEDKLEAGENVALSGRVYVKANTSAGLIAPGDLLTTSDVPGEAMKAADHQRSQGAIIGKAMTELDEGTGMVLVLVTLQ